MTRRPTTKAGIIAAVGALLVVVGTTAQAGWLFVLSAGVLGLVASGLVQWHRLGSATVTRTLPARARVGDAVTVGLSVHNPSRRRLPVMRVADSFPAFDESAVACESMRPGASATAELECVARRRGVFSSGDVALTTAAPFGLMRTRKDVTVPSRLIVHPAIEDMSGFPLPETAAVTSDEAFAVARSGAGEVFAGVRDYRPGDQRRWIHWRTTARTGRLAVREHEEPARSPVVLVVAGLRGDDGTERVAIAAASVGLYALDQGRPVHCVGRGWFGEHVENATRLGILDWAAGLDASDSTLEDEVASAFRRWGRRCSFILFESEHGIAEHVAEVARRKGADVKVAVVCNGKHDHDVEVAP